MIVRNGLEQLLGHPADDIELVGMASDGAEGLDLVAELQPDVVLMDLSMPEMDGVEATKRIVAVTRGENPGADIFQRPDSHHGRATAPVPRATC